MAISDVRNQKPAQTVYLWGLLHTVGDTVQSSAECFSLGTLTIIAVDGAVGLDKSIPKRRRLLGGNA